MKYNELVEYSIDYLRRPDLLALVQQRALNAITAVHSVGIFPQDRIESTSAVVTAGRVGQAPRPQDMRLVDTVIALDAQGNQIEQLTRKSTTELMKLRRLGQDTSTYYETDGQISFKCSAEASSLLVLGIAREVRPSALVDGLGQPIPLDQLDYQTWLMAENPQAFIDYVVGHMEYVLGNIELGSNYLRIFNTTHRDWLQDRAAGYSGE